MHDPQPPKLDSAPTDGLSGVSNSLAYRVEEIEKHLHNRERWLGLAAAPNAEIHCADDGVMTPRVTAGIKLFSRCWVSGQNTGTMDFFVGLHEYEG